MKNHIREYFDMQPVQMAQAEYKGIWESVLDDSKGYQLLIDHAWDLGERLIELKERFGSLTEQMNGATHGSAKSVIGTARSHVRNDIKILEKVRQNIRAGGGDILTELQQEARHVIDMLNQGDRAIVDEKGGIRSSTIKQLYANSRPTTWERYATLDALYEKGEEFAINLEHPEDRAYQLAKIPRKIREAKWQYMLAVADAAYSIDFGHIGGESIDPNHLKLLSGMFARLSDRERGADNEHIPKTHKFRHNPAIHSLHTLALADKMFHEVWRDIDHDRGIPGEGKKKYFQTLKHMRRRVFQAALTHDMGEIDGELSQGIIVAHMNHEEKVIAKETREPLERATFEHYLEKQREHLRHIHNGHATQEPIRDDEWAEIKKGYHEAYDLSDKKDIFLGRFFKTLECMQSQQDYLRFQTELGAKPLIESDDANKVFSVNYVSKQFYDMENWDSVPGPQSLRRLAEKTSEKNGNGQIEVILQRRLTAVMESEITRLMRKNFESYYGAGSPEALRFAATEQRRSLAHRNVA